MGIELGRKSQLPLSLINDKIPRAFVGKEVTNFDMCYQNVILQLPIYWRQKVVK